MPTGHRPLARRASGFDRRTGSGYTSTMLPISPAERRALRARAHALHPVVAIGHAGLTPSVLHEVDVALTAHELVKVRAHTDDRDERERYFVAICEALAAAPVQHLGKMLIVWRPRPKPEREERAERRASGSRPKGSRKGAKGAPTHRGAAPPRVGTHTARHRRGASRHAPDVASPDAQARAHPTRRRRASKPAAEPAVPTTSAPRGARFRHGKPVLPKGKRPAQSPSGKRPAPATKRGPGAGAAAPESVRRRRRPTGGGREP